MACACYLCVAFLLGFILTLSNAEPHKPHILFMLVDDWGWANVGYHSASIATKEVVTPNIDHLVKDGLQLDQHYAFKLCSPSRSSFLTGRLPIHVNDDNKINPASCNPNDPISGYQGIPRNMTVIAEKLRQAGYATHQVGKWDVGMATWNHTPEGRGFDSSLCYFHHDNYYYNETNSKCFGRPIVDLWNTGKPAYSLNGTGPDGGYEEALFKERILNIIRNHNQSQPLFLYYATHAPHDPYQVPERYMKRFDFIDYYWRQIYHAMVTYVDDVVGEIVGALKETGLWDNLLLITSSDNGGPVGDDKGANNYPLKGGKSSDWQGGVRVNAFVAGGYLPKKMKGRVTSEYIHIADWYATFCSLAGIDPIDNKALEGKLPPIDSLDVWPLISGENETSPRVDIPLSYNALISGDYKILTGPVNNDGWTGPLYPNSSIHVLHGIKECGSGCLYNIKADPIEHHNLASKDEYRSILWSMQSKLSMYQSTYFNPDRGDICPEACEKAINNYHGYWGPFL